MVGSFGTDGINGASFFYQQGLLFPHRYFYSLPQKMKLWSAQDLSPWTQGEQVSGGFKRIV